MAPRARPIDQSKARAWMAADSAVRLIARVRLIRFSFLAKFTLLTLLVTGVTGAGLSYFLIAKHEAAVEANEGVTAAGEVTAFFSGALAKSAARGQQGDTAGQRLIISQAEASAKRIQFVTAVRVFRPDGSELYPGLGPPDVSDTHETLQRGDLWSQRIRAPLSGDDVTMQWLPLENDEASYVLAIELSRAQMTSDIAQERRAVLQGTAIAYVLISLSLFALAGGASRELERRRRQSETLFVQTLEIFAATIDCRDPYTAGHSRRVATYARALAHAVGLPQRDCGVIEHSALLHDLGKIGVPDSVLLKPGPLDANERFLIQCHPALGAHMLESITGMEDIVPCVLHHHERIDGAGYPGRLSGSNIPVGARIIAVADTFDAMTTSRPYRRALPVEVAVRELHRVAGTQLEHAYVAAFVTLVQTGAFAPPVVAPPEQDDENLFGPRALEALRVKFISELETKPVPSGSDDSLSIRSVQFQTKTR